MNWQDGNNMSAGDWVIVSLIMVVVWAVLILATVSVWRGTANRLRRPEQDPTGERPE